MRPKKSFSQNFLINDSVSEQIVDLFIQRLSSSNILEVGPGQGALSRFLAKKKNLNYLAVEADRDMVSYLTEEDILKPGQILQSDILKLDLARVFDGQGFSIIGNLPYSISTQILFKIFESKQLVETAVLMFQKEVAERMVSGPGNKTYGITSVMIQSCYEAQIILQVKSGSFYPRPRVQSAVVELIRKQDYELPCDPATFKSVVKTSFNQRRKMLRNSLKMYIADSDIRNHRFMSKRPEQLSLEDFYQLTELIQNQKDESGN